MSFLYIFRLFITLRKAVISTMYKKLHTPEKEPSAEPFCDKGSFLWCVPERVIMLTNVVYHIQRKSRKTPYFRREFFCRAPLFLMIHLSWVVCSNYFCVIHLDNLLSNGQQHILCMTNTTTLTLFSSFVRMANSPWINSWASF